MARSQQTDLAVLGALSLGPLSGYAVREGIRDVLGQFWSESFGQIYPALSRLEAKGQVERLAGTRQGSSRYALTTAGRERLHELLASPIELAPPRNGLLLRLFFGHELGAQACTELVREQRERAAETMESLTRPRRKPSPTQRTAATRCWSSRPVSTALPPRWSGQMRHWPSCSRRLSDLP